MKRFSVIRLCALLLSLMFFLSSCSFLPSLTPNSPGGNEKPSSAQTTDSSATKVSCYLNGKRIGEKDGEEAPFPTVTVPTGYDFDGWYSDEACTVVYEGGANAYALLRPIVYRIDCDLHGGSSDNPTTYTIESDEIVLSAPVRDGYTFGGWIKDGATYGSVTIPKGASGDLSFDTVWKPIEYTITYDYDGGNAANPATYTIETDDFTLASPTRPRFTFAGWRDGNMKLSESVTVKKGTFGNLSFTALWMSHPYTLTCSSDPVTVPIGGAELTKAEFGTPLLLSVPENVGNYRFAGWVVNGELLSTAAMWTYSMPDKDTTIVAKYAEIPVCTYDKTSGNALAVSFDTTSTPTALYGGNAKILSDVSYAAGKVTLSQKYLSSLSVGTYDYAVETSDKWFSFRLNVVSSTLPADARVTYDTPHFPAPAIEFTCACGGTHAYSLDGGTYVPVQSGDAIASFDKTSAHTVKLRCEAAPANEVTILTDAIEAGAEEFYNNSFEFLGKTYDYVINDMDELSTLVEYLALVEGVAYYREHKTETPITYFWIGGDFVNAFNADSSAVYAEAFSRNGFPMSMQYSTSHFGSTIPRKKGISFTYKYGLNEIVSTQKKTVLTDRQNLLTSSGRAPGAKFPIDRCESTVKIRNFYELELLPYGSRPVFDDSAADAKEVYEAARQILASIADDGMDDYRKVAAIYSWLALNVTYDNVAFAAENAPIYRAFTAYGALIDRVAVCDGFASAFRLMCQIEGIECLEVSGLQKLGDPTSGHAWNKFRIGETWYATEATWARQGEYVTLHYLFLDEERIVTYGHYENGRVADRYTGQATFSGFDWFRSVSTSGTYDLEISSSAELVAAVQYQLANEIPLMQIHVVSGKIDSYISDAVKAAGKSISYAGNDETGYFFLSFK